MGNIGSYSGQVSGNQESGLITELVNTKRYLAPKSLVRSSPKTGTQPQVKVLPELELGQRLRNTNNGEILHSGGTLSGRHQTPLRNVQSNVYSPNQRNSFDKTGFESNQNVPCRKTCDPQIKLCRSEPDLRFAAMIGQETEEKKNRKKYKAPPPPTNVTVQEPQSANWDKNLLNNYPSRRTRLFKTRHQSKKEFSIAANTLAQSADKNNFDIVEEEIRARKNINVLRPKSLFEFNFNGGSNEFKEELREATDRLRATKLNAVKSEGQFGTTEHLTEPELNPKDNIEIESGHCPRGEPSGKESSASETSPLLGASDIQTPRRFYFGMVRKDSDASSSYPVEDDDENLTIALRLRPVLPRKPPQIPRFSPAAAWKLLDARSQDSGISGDARPVLPFSWTPQQDLEDDSSVDEAIRDEPDLARKQRQRQSPHIFSLSLPRDHYTTSAMTVTSNKGGDNSLSRLKRSVSGVLNTLSIKREQEKVASSREDDSNWFFTRSAPNSLNEHSLEIPEACFPHISSTARLMYLPETNTASVKDKCHLPPVFAKSCEELFVPESLRDPKTVLEIPWYKEARQKKTKKFTFQSTVRQIERKRMADRLSKEAEKKEKQRLGELEAMRRVEEEFQRKRAKEKASIRQQLRLYALNDNNQWTSLPHDVNLKAEERQEPDGALSSSNSSLSPPKVHEEQRKNKNLEDNAMAQTTKELSEFRQVQRDYKDYRRYTKHVVDNKHFKQSTIHPEVTCNMPNVKGLNSENGNYRKNFASGLKSTKSTDSNQSEDFQQLNTPKMYRNKYSTPVTRF